MAVLAPPRASYAADPSRSRGRGIPEAESGARNAFRRDCDRIIHSAAFRRLKHKTQVFVAHESDHYRTRLTHTLEVTQIARSLARALGLDEDLAEAAALAHDLGHPPFGHAGERALDRCLEAHGGFDHNAQALRVVTRLERRYPAYDGLNLTWETLEGLVKHNGPLRDAAGAPFGRYAGKGVPAPIADYDREHPLDLHTHASAEAQAAAIADDIAYNAHDIDDGLRAGLFRVDDLGAIPLIESLHGGILSEYPRIDPARLGYEIVRRLIHRLIADVMEESARRIEQLKVESVDDIRAAPHPVVAFSAEMREAELALKAFLLPRMYRHTEVMQVMAAAEAVVERLYARYCAEPAQLPEDWRPSGRSEASDARRVGDFIAGMTDRYALLEHARLFDTLPQLG